MIHVKFFGPLAEVVGQNDLEMGQLKDVAALREKLIFDFPQLSTYKTLISVNKKLVNESQTLNDGDEVAFLPPFAGG